MKNNLPTRTLREKPDLDQLKRQAKELLEAFTAGEAAAVAEVNAHYRDADAATFALHDAQLALARAYGFDSWPKLKAYIDGATVKRLADAVRAGDLAQVHVMLKVRPELVSMDMAENNEHRALHYAVLNRSPEMVRVLMQYGADARKGIYPHRDATGAHTLAIERGYDEIAAIIQEEERRRREQHQRAAGGSQALTPALDDLMEAVRKGEEDRAAAILEGDPSLAKACNRDGWTSLHAAVVVRNERLVGLLLERGADANSQGPGGQTPLDLAAARGWPSSGSADAFTTLAVMLRKRGAELAARSAVALGETGWLRARHAEGTLVNPIEDAGGLLTIAAKHDRPDVLALLLDLGFDPDERLRVVGLEEVVYSWGMPLQHCAGSGKLAMAEMLLQRGAEPNGQVYAAGTPVSKAYRARDAAMLALLERHGGVIAAATAGYHRDTDLARRMLVAEAAGRLPAGTVPPGKTVAEELLDGDCGDPEIVRMALDRIDWPRDDRRWYGILGGPLAFWNHIPWIESNKWKFDRSTYLTCFRLILARCNANLRGTYGRTILHDVVAMGRRTGARDWVTEDEVAAFAMTLLDAGARFDVRDDLLKSTPLGWACRWGRVGLVRLLLERGADPVEADAEPWATPMAWARKKGHEAVLALLREHQR